MDTPGSDLASGNTEPPSPTSADPSPADSPGKTTPDNLESLIATNMSLTAVTETNDDSDSDVSMSADTDDEDNTGHDTPDSQVLSSLQGLPQSDAPVNPAVEAPKKRKHSGSSLKTPNGQLDHQIRNESRKRVRPIVPFPSYRTPQGRLRPDKSLLPAEIWHHVFSFCLPRVLGLSLQVNRCFNTYLDPSTPKSPVVSLSHSSLQVLQADAIWRASRLLFRQGMPGPLSGKSELDMWRMACSSRCQFCHKKEISSSIPVDQWHPGPGMTGLARIWSFGIRACGSCIQQNTTKEIDLLLSSAIESQLLVGLPFIFLTSELHIIPPTTLQSGQQPSSLQISKRFPNFQIEEIKREFQDAKVLGEATMEEWVKGLEERGREMRTDAARWERWELSGGLASMRPVASHEVKKEPVVKVEKSNSNGASPLYRFQPTNPLPQRNFPPFTNARPSQNPYPPQPSNAPPHFETPPRNGFTPYPQPPRVQPQIKHERTKDEVASLKAARRAEIERRSMLLSPPLTAAVLAHMPSFQAAIQIIQPLTDDSWEVLKPRLLSQRGEAEQRETDRLAQTRVVQERFDERRYQDAQARSGSKEILDREWDDVQTPLRSRIGGYADEIIREGWNGGEKVDYDNSPRFAADVLVYVRKRFYAEMAKDEAAARATGQEPALDPPNGPYLRKLILENMKWVFDTKIKVHTEQYRKELFLCSACETNPKYYGFEGVIQHYAAKHTNELSCGSIVVHWKAEWPERPPFNPDPAPSSNQAYYSAAPSASAPFVTNGPVLHTNYGYGGYHPASGPPISAPMAVPMHAHMPHQMQAPLPPPIHGQNPHGYQESQGPYYGHPHYSDQYPGHPNGPYAPPQPYQDNSQVYHGLQQYSAPPPANNGYQEVPHDYPQQRFANSYQPPNQGMYAPANQGPQYQTAPDIPVQQDAYPYQGNHYGQNYNQVPSYPTNTVTPPPAPPQRSEEYKAQLLDVAKSASEVWNTISAIKELSGSVKVYTIIYHLLVRSRTLYPEDPALAMIIDGLANNKDMRPMRSINGLLCKTCTSELTGSKGNQKKHFSIQQLLSHFHTIHEQGISKNTGRSLDWTKDMVELPDIAKLASAINNSKHKLDPGIKLVKEAIPELDPSIPVPEERASGGRNYDHVAPNSYSPELAPSQDNHSRYYSSAPKAGPSKPDAVPYDSGEYDPRNPMEIPLEPRPVLRAAPQADYPREHEREIPQAVYRLAPHSEERREIVYRDRPERVYDDRRPVSPPPRARPSEYYERVVIREEVPLHDDRRPRYRESAERSEYRDPAPLPYHARGAQLPVREYPYPNLEFFSSDRQEIQPVATTSEQSRIIDVVAQIPQQAQRVQERIPLRHEAAEHGSEDGEVRTKPASKSASYQPEPAEEATDAAEAADAAERFLNSFLPVEAPQEEAVSRTPRPDEMKPWEPERGEHLRHVYQPQEESHRRIREISRVPSRGRLAEEGMTETRSAVRDRLPLGQSRAYGYDDRYDGSLPEHLTVRERSPELVDRRYKVNNVVYRDERQSRTTNRYARYENIRLENDRARSRSPVYVKVGGQPAQYRERSPVRYSLQETVYRAHTPQMMVDEYAHERQPRHGYYRVYADEPRPGPQYATETYELVRVSDARGEYVIRRPIRREPAEPVYASYGDDGYARQPLYESRAPVSRPHEPSYEEEYDPRHPEPLAPVRQASRYQ